MTIIEVEMRVREHQQQMLEIGENNRLLWLAGQPISLKTQLAKVLLAFSQRLAPQLGRANSSATCRGC